MFGLEGKRVVITGAGGGIGAALVAEFACHGARVVACDMDAATLPAEGVTEVHRFDLRDRAATLAATGAILADGVPDVVVSNAGRTRAETMDQVTPEALEEEMTLNFRAAADLTTAFLQAMRARPDGAAFVLISSVNAIRHFGNPVYSAAKAALCAWARAIAAEEGVHGIRANVVAPGSVRTPSWDHRLARDPTLAERVARLYPIGRLVQPEEVARATAFLASPLASGITGVTLPVDGGVSSSYLPFIRELA